MCKFCRTLPPLHLDHLDYSIQRGVSIILHTSNFIPGTGCHINNFCDGVNIIVATCAVLFDMSYNYRNANYYVVCSKRFPRSEVTTFMQILLFVCMQQYIT